MSRSIPRTLYHGSNVKFDSFSKRRIKRGEAFFLTPYVRYAEIYGKYVYEVQVERTNIFDYTDKQHLEMLSEAVDKILEKEKEKPYGQDMSFYPLTKSKVFQGITSGEWYFLEQPLIIKAMKKLKFDGFFSYEGQEENYGFFDPKNLTIVKQIKESNKEFTTMSFIKSDQTAKQFIDTHLAYDAVKANKDKIEVPFDINRKL